MGKDFRVGSFWHREANWYDHPASSNSRTLQNNVIEKAREAGENDPLITRAPQSNMALIL